MIKYILPKVFILQILGTTFGGIVTQHMIITNNQINTTYYQVYMEENGVLALPKRIVCETLEGPWSHFIFMGRTSPQHYL
jgi:hypothetical protein